jgi:hypothetical protein
MSWPRGNQLRGDESKAQDALPQERKRANAKGGSNYATQFQSRSQVDHGPVSGQMRRTELSNLNQPS